MKRAMTMISQQILQNAWAMPTALIARINWLISKASIRPARSRQPKSRSRCQPSKTSGPQVTITSFLCFDKAKSWTRHADFREDPDIESLGTPSGRIEIFSKKVASFGYEGIKGHAQWIEPTEWLGSSEATGGAMLHMVSPHPEYRIHSQMNNSDARKEYVVQDREPIEISEADAKALGIADGDVVRVYNDRGQSLAGAVVTKDLMAGVVRFCEGAWYDPDKPGEVGALDKYGSPNQLTRDVPSSKIGQATTAHTTLVKVEKFTGDLPPVTTFGPAKNG